MLLRHIFAFSLFSASAVAQADAINANLSNNTAQFEYIAASGNGTQGQSDLHVGMLYNNVNSVLVNGGLLVVNRLQGAPGVRIGVGLEALAARIDDNPPTKYNASAMAVDALVRFSPPAAEQLGIVGEIHYAPKIITFGDANRYSQVGARLEYEISPQMLAYVGYRKITFGIKNSIRDAVMDNGAHLGVRIAF